MQRNCQNVPGAAGAAAGGAAASAACLYYRIQRGREAPLWKYVIKYMQQTKQQKQQQLQRQPQQLQGHFGNFFEKVQTHVAQAHLVVSRWY